MVRSLGKPSSLLVKLALMASASPLAIHAADFSGSGLGWILDNDASGRNVQFTVSGLAFPLAEVRLSMTMTHSWVGDLEATLTSPGGLARLVIFSRTGSGRKLQDGSSANLGGTYIFRDDAANDWWETAAITPGLVNIPAGNYRTSTPGQPLLSDIGGCATYLSKAFGGLSAAQTNGVWTLNIADHFSPDSGSITGATLSLTGQEELLSDAETIFRSGFESAPNPSAIRGNCNTAAFDFTGTGLTSYTVVRDTGGELTWSVKNNDGGISGTIENFKFGDVSDVLLDGDFDGDGIRDPAVWRADPAGTFIVRRSSRPGDAPLLFEFGQLGDDPRHTGDYDADGISDPAVYRAGALPGEASHTIILLSTTGLIRDLVTGTNGDAPSGGIDHTGDGIADILIQSDAGGVGHFTGFNGLSGELFNDFNFGLFSDSLITANYLGSAIGDITVARDNAGMIEWTSRDGDSGVEAAPLNFGSSATDFILSGDFDGDGLNDYAIWNPSAMPGTSKFSVLKSTFPAPPLEVLLGEEGDYPVPNANARRH